MTQQHHSDEQQDELGFERVADALKGAFDEVPEADRTALWSVVESGLGPQHVPWHLALRNSIGNFVGSLQGPARQMAIAGAAVAVVGALFLSGVFENGNLSGVFENGNRASAAVLEQANELSVATEAALADGVLSAEEIADLHERALALLAEIESDPEALNVLTPADLKLVIELLSIVGDDLDDFVDDDHGELDDDFDEVVESILETTGLAETFREERGDEDGDDGDKLPGVLGAVESDETPEADETSEADGTPEAEGTSEADGTPEPEETSEADGTPEAEETSEADGTSEADETPEADGTPEADETPGVEEGDGGGEATPEPEESGSEQTSTVIAGTPGEYTFAAGDAGSVTFSFDGTDLEVLSVSEAADWESSVGEGEGEELDVTFRSGDLEMKFEVQRDGSDLRITTKLKTETSDDD